MHTSKQTSAVTTPAGKKKNCKCCAKRVERVKKANKDLLERNPLIKKVLTATEHKMWMAEKIAENGTLPPRDTHRWLPLGR